MEESLASGFCTHCGSQVMNENIAANMAQSAADRQRNMESLLRLCKHHLEDGDSVQAYNLLNEAMKIDSANSDCWYMDAVLDSKNRESDIRRAAEYPSLGIFTRQDLDRFGGVKRTTNGVVVYVVCFMILFFVVGGMLPLGFIFDFKPALYTAGIIAVAVISFAVYYWRKTTKPV